MFYLAATKPIVSSAEVHTQRQQMPFNLGLGYTAFSLWRCCSDSNCTVFYLAATEPITSSAEVHTQRQQQPFNMGLGYIITLTVAGVLLVFGSALVCFGKSNKAVLKKHFESMIKFMLKLQISQMLTMSIRDLSGV